MSGAGHYRRGTRREKLTAARLTADGYYVTESRGSHGVADLVAIKPGQALLVQVKDGTAELRDEWWNPLWRAARDSGALAILADWPPVNRRGAELRLRRITGPHIPRSHRWPCEPFATDEVGI